MIGPGKRPRLLGPSEISELIVDSDSDGVRVSSNVSTGERGFLTPCRTDGLLIKYPQFPDVLNTLNVQPHIIFLLMV